MNNRFVLRRAIETDNVALSELNRQTFRETHVDGFAISYGEHNLESYFRSSVSPESFASKIANPRQAAWIVEDKTNGDLIAFATAGPCELSHSEVHLGEDGELYRLYVRRDRQSCGLGQRLMNVALAWLEEQFSGRPIWLGVWSGNLKAQKFYEHYNFKKVADHHYQVGDYRTDDFIMRRECPLS